MIVVGIDPSLTHMGVASSVNGRTSVGSASSTKGAGDLADMRNRIRYLVGTALTFAPPSIDLTVIEKPIIPHGHTGGAVLDRAWLYGLLVDQFLTRGPVVGVQQALRAKYAAGSGNAKKPEVLAAIREAFPDLAVRDDNEADALALVAMGARHLDDSIDGIHCSKKQSEAMAGVAWPITEKREQ